MKQPNNNYDVLIVKYFVSRKWVNDKVANLQETQTDVFKITNKLTLHHTQRLVQLAN